MATLAFATTISNGTGGIFNLINAAVSGGYKFPQYSDGLTLTTPGSPLTSNPYTTSGSGAGGLGNTWAWFRMQSPDGSREFLFARSSTDPVWTFARSKTGFVSGSASATLIPTDATTGVTLMSASTIFDATPGRWLVSVENAAPYGFFAFSVPTGGGNVKTMLWDEPLATGTYIADDNDPYIFGIYYNSTGLPTTGGSFVVSPSSTAICYKRYRHGLSSPSNTRIDYLHYRTSAATGPVAPTLDINNQVAVDPYNSKEIPIPILVTKAAAPSTSSGYIGILNRQKWSSAAGRSNGQTLFDSTNTLYWIHCAGAWIPWDPTSPVI